MKSVVISIIIVAAIVFASSANAAYCANTVENYTKMLSEITRSGDEYATCSDIADCWKEQRKVIALTVARPYVCAVDIAVAELVATSRSEEKADFDAAVRKASAAFENIRRIGGFSLGSIL